MLSHVLCCSVEACRDLYSNYTVYKLIYVDFTLIMVFALFEKN